MRAWTVTVFDGANRDAITDLLVLARLRVDSYSYPREESTLTVDGVPYRPAYVGEDPDVTLTGEGPDWLPRAWVRKYPRKA